jgi:hypothetical protein
MEVFSETWFEIFGGSPEVLKEQEQDESQVSGSSGSNGTTDLN